MCWSDVAVICWSDVEVMCWSDLAVICWSELEVMCWSDLIWQWCAHLSFIWNELPPHIRKQTYNVKTDCWISVRCYSDIINFIQLVWIKIKIYFYLYFRSLNCLVCTFLENCGGNSCEECVSCLVVLIFHITIRIIRYLQVLQCRISQEFLFSLFLIHSYLFYLQYSLLTPNFVDCICV